jgi:hypothetical protein
MPDGAPEAAAMTSPQSAGPERRPEVIVDLAYEDGDLFVSVWNIGAAPARDVRVRFDRPLVGAGETKFDGLRLFRGIPFLAPGRRITAFLDTAASCASRGQATAFTATVAWSDETGARYETICPHDLAIYIDLPARLRRDKGEAGS